MTPAASPRPQPRDAFLAAGVFLAVLVAYFPALRAGLIWNDPDYLTKPALRSLAGLGRIWFQLGATEQYYPVLHSAFWLEHRLWGEAPLGYHLINVLLHATAACLFALVLRRLTGERTWPWLAALLFALHPVGVESVAWISEQKNTLSTVFYLAAFELLRLPAWFWLFAGWILLGWRRRRLRHLWPSCRAACPHTAQRTYQVIQQPAPSRPVPRPLCRS